MDTQAAVLLVAGGTGPAGPELPLPPVVRGVHLEHGVQDREQDGCSHLAGRPVRLLLSQAAAANIQTVISQYLCLST